MSRAQTRPVRSLVRSLAFPALVFAAWSPAAAPSTAAAAPPAPRVRLADGGVVVAGEHPARDPACADGGQAWVAAVDTAGRAVWRRTVAPSGSGGGDPEAPMIEVIAELESEHVIASRVRALAVDPVAGGLIVVGDLVIAWQGDDGPQAARGAFAIRLHNDGTTLAGRYLGTPPDGPPLAPPVSCAEVCATLDEGRHSHRGGSGVRLADDGTVVVSGWRLAPAGAGARLTALRVDALSVDLAATLWTIQDAQPADGVALDAVLDDSGRVFVTGYGRSGRDAFVARYLRDEADGTRERFAAGGGDYDDQGEQLDLVGGEVRVTGSFTAAARFDGVDLAGDGSGRTGFVARYDPDLRLLAAETFPIDIPPPAPATAPAQRGGSQAGMPMVPRNEEDEGDHSHPADILGFLVPGGRWGTGGARQLIYDDGHALSLHPTYDAAGQGSAELVIALALYADAPYLTEVKLAPSSYGCSTVTVALGGGLASGFVTIGSAQLCPLTGSSLVFPVPPELNAWLGVEDPLVASGVEPVLLAVTFAFASPAQTCTPVCQLSSAEEASLDQIEVKTEYGL